MAQTKVTASLLRDFAQTLRTEKDRFQSIKSSMDQKLTSFLWEDPIATRFKSQYQEGLAPVEQKLIPAMDNYQVHLNKEAGVIEEWLQ